MSTIHVDAPAPGSINAARLRALIQTKVRQRHLVLACLAALSSAVVAPVAAQSARVVYALNCLGCHPVPEGASTTHSSARPAGEFVQLPLGRQFFMRLPSADGHPLSAEDDARLIAEIFELAQVLHSRLTQFTGGGFATSRQTRGHKAES